MAHKQKNTAINCSFIQETYAFFKRSQRQEAPPPILSPSQKQHIPAPPIDSEVDKKGKGEGGEFEQRRESLSKLLWSQGATNKSHPALEEKRKKNSHLALKRVSVTPANVGPKKAVIFGFD